MIDLISEIIESIRRNPSRAILSSIGISWGIFILVLLIGVGNGLSDGVIKLFSGFSQSATYVATSSVSVGYKSTAVGKQIRLEQSDLDYLARNVPEISDISPVVSTSALVNNGQHRGMFTINAVAPSYFNIKLTEIESGRLLNQLDFAQNRKVVLIGSNVAEVVFPHEYPIGKTLSFGNATYTVVGLIENTMLSSLMGGDAQAVYVPYSTFITTNADAKKFQVFYFSTKTDKTAKEINDRVRELLAYRFQFSKNDNNVLYFSSLEEQVSAFNSLFDLINDFMWFVGISTLISGVIGIGNIMYSTAKERTKEIGIRKAMGATSSQVKTMFIFESIGLTAFAGMIGMAFGWALLQLIALFISEDSLIMAKPSIDLSVAASALMVLVVSGVIAGLRPAIYASNLNPIDALRVEN
ncbi:MAG: ABC transporter permease [Bacteroidales bacterium]|nr:ABC transporter permease [Bacteroidales bacterium]